MDWELVCVSGSSRCSTPTTELGDSFSAEPPTAATTATAATATPILRPTDLCIQPTSAPTILRPTDLCIQPTSATSTSTISGMRSRTNLGWEAMSSSKHACSTATASTPPTTTSITGVRSRTNLGRIALQSS